jgi:hypothetical protein
MAEQSEATPRAVVDEIRRAARARLEELRPLVAEVEQLESVIAALDAADEAERTPSTSPRPRSRPSGERVPRPARARRSPARGRDGRAPQGSNKQLILATIAEHPRSAAPEIAQITGIKRTIVASTMSRLKRTGELVEHDSGLRVVPRTDGVASIVSGVGAS